MAKGKRAESRCRYLVREIANQKGWNIKHPQKGGGLLRGARNRGLFSRYRFRKDKTRFFNLQTIQANYCC